MSFAQLNYRFPCENSIVRSDVSCSNRAGWQSFRRNEEREFTRPACLLIWNRKSTAVNSEECGTWTKPIAATRRERERHTRRCPQLPVSVPISNRPRLRQLRYSRAKLNATLPTRPSILRDSAGCTIMCIHTLPDNHIVSIITAISSIKLP